MCKFFGSIPNEFSAELILYIQHAGSVWFGGFQQSRCGHEMTHGDEDDDHQVCIDCYVAGCDGITKRCDHVILTTLGEF
jgi:hypothetical protein